MRRSRMVTVVVVAMVCGLGGGAWAVEKDTGEERRPVPMGERGMATFVDGINTFGLNMFGQLSGTEGNLFFSPLSLHAALSMASVGARRETHAEMAEVLGLPWHEAGDRKPENAGRYYAEFLDGLLKDASKVKSQELAIANGLWVDKREQVVKGFAEVMKRDFQAESSVADLSDADAAAKLINGWVAKKTKDRIQDIVSREMLEGGKVLVLANAVYFKNAWAEEFSKGRTTDGEFRLGGDKTVKAKMMFRQGEYEYAETDDVQVLSMPYVGYQFSMVFVLPKKADGLSAVEKGLSADQLKTWTKFESEDVRVTLPRFKVTQGFDAKESLQSMGMKRAFIGGGKDGANFAGLVADSKRVYIGFVVHKAFVAVDEVGTEAAAATVVGFARAGAPLEPKEPKEFKADHPFLFMIRHNQTGAILFMGRMADPTKE